MPENDTLRKDSHNKVLQQVRGKFAEEMMSSGTVCAIRKEPGNLRYEYFYPADDEETVAFLFSFRQRFSGEIKVYNSALILCRESKKERDNKKLRNAKAGKRLRNIHLFFLQELLLKVSNNVKNYKSDNKYKKGVREC